MFFFRGGRRRAEVGYNALPYGSDVDIDSHCLQPQSWELSHTTEQHLQWASISVTLNVFSCSPMAGLYRRNILYLWPQAKHFFVTLMATRALPFVVALGTNQWRATAHLNANLDLAQHHNKPILHDYNSLATYFLLHHQVLSSTQ